MDAKKKPNPGRTVIDSKNNSNVRVQFDKKKWRLKRYSKKFKIEQWEEKRKKAALRKYHKELQKENPDLRKPLLVDEEHGVKDKSNKKPKLTAYQAAQLEYERKCQEKQQMKEEALRKKMEREEALKKYHLKKTERNKKLSKKTQKGQPIMRDRMQLLLDKIQAQI